MNRCAILLEGASDTPVVREIFQRHFGLQENIDFSLHPHRGKGQLPTDFLGKASIARHGLLDQLPAKLRGMSHYPLVVVLIDLDDESLSDQASILNDMLNRLPKRPATVLFRFAIEETESWFIADFEAVKKAYPSVNTNLLKRIQPDAIVGAWEHLADALTIKRKSVTGPIKVIWANDIAPHLDLFTPKSPSLKTLIDDLDNNLRSGTV
jgi:hypothetical protein